MSKIVEEFALQLQRIEQAERQGKLRRRQVNSLIRLADQYSRSVSGIDDTLRHMQFEVGKRTRPTRTPKKPRLVTIEGRFSIQANIRGSWETIYHKLTHLSDAMNKANIYGRNNGVETRVMEHD